MTPLHRAQFPTVPTSVLIVDDQEDIRILVRALIRGADDEFAVTGEAANGEEALAALDNADPEVIVLDQMMPGMTGLETARRILERRPGQRILLFSAYLSDEIREEAAAVGVTDCLAKDQVARIADALRAIAA
ncbi:MAG: two-component system, chemotaxis family, chemotaxis protein CheY [Actinomycetota bacterium]